MFKSVFSDGDDILTPPTRRRTHSNNNRSSTKTTSRRSNPPAGLVSSSPKATTYIPTIFYIGNKKLDIAIKMGISRQAFLKTFGVSLNDHILQYNHPIKKSRFQVNNEEQWNNLCKFCKSTCIKFKGWKLELFAVNISSKKPKPLVNKPPVSYVPPPSGGRTVNYVSVNITTKPKPKTFVNKPPVENIQAPPGINTNNNQNHFVFSPPSFDFQPQAPSINPSFNPDYQQQPQMSNNKNYPNVPSF